MALSYTIEMADHLTARVAGELDLDAAIRTMAEVLAECAARGAERLFVDVREVSGALSTVDRYHFVEGTIRALRRQQEAGHLLGLRLAFVGRAPLIDPELFGQTVGRNRGMNVKATTDGGEAIRWLSAPA